MQGERGIGTVTVTAVCVECLFLKSPGQDLTGLIRSAPSVSECVSVCLLLCHGLLLGSTLCVSLFYVIDTGSTGSRGPSRTWGLCLPFTLTLTLKLAVPYPYFAPCYWVPQSAWGSLGPGSRPRVSRCPSPSRRRQRPSDRDSQASQAGH